MMLQTELDSSPAIFFVRGSLAFWASDKNGSARELQTFLVFSQHPSWVIQYAGKPIESAVYCLNKCSNVHFGPEHVGSLLFSVEAEHVCNSHSTIWPRNRSSMPKSACFNGVLPHFRPCGNAIENHCFQLKVSNIKTFECV